CLPSARLAPRHPLFRHDRRRVGGGAGFAQRAVTLVVSDSSPLIALSQINQIKLLHDLFGEVVIPGAVAREVSPGVRLPTWITTRPLAMRVGLELLLPKLGLGETEAVVLAAQDGADWLLLGERPARRIAHRAWPPRGRHAGAARPREGERTPPRGSPPSRGIAARGLLRQTKLDPAHPQRRRGSRGMR